MPDKRQHRGPHPQDRVLFGAAQIATLQAAVAELSWLLTHGYAMTSAVKLVGDRHDLSVRQRTAVWRSACSDQARAHRRSKQRPLAGAPSIGVDGYNALILVESALSGGLILRGRDGCYRDLASLHGTYRRVQETAPALSRIAGALIANEVPRVDWYLDQPVSNSGRLKTFMAEELERYGWLGRFNIALVPSPDRILRDYAGTVVTSDAAILDHCRCWTHVIGPIIDSLGDAWIIDFVDP